MNIIKRILNPSFSIPEYARLFRWTIWGLLFFSFVLGVVFFVKGLRYMKINNKQGTRYAVAGIFLIVMIAIIFIIIL